MNLIFKYLDYVKNIRRYSNRTVEIYSDVLKNYAEFTFKEERKTACELIDREITECLNPSEIRSYEVALLDQRGLSAKTVNLHLSVLSGFCRFLIKNDALKSNPVKLIPRPKMGKRLPAFFKKDALEEYFESSEVYTSEQMLEILITSADEDYRKQVYKRRLDRLIVSCLYSLGLRRSELIGMNISDIDFSRKVVRVRGKGDKMREIPLIFALSEEILLYLKAVEATMGKQRSLSEPLLVTWSGKRLYPVYVDRAVKTELGQFKSVTGQKSPHVLRHSLATELLDEGSDLNSIKELLGHSSLAATQVYTHNTAARLKLIYQTAHPRAKNGGKYGD